MQISVSQKVSALLDTAAALSISRGRFYVGVEHLFEVIVSDSSALPPAITSKYAKRFARLLKVLKDRSWRGNPPQAGDDVYYTPRCARVITEANTMARKLRSEETTAAHLLLAILAEADGLPARVMDDSRLNRETVMDDLSKCVHLSGKSGVSTRKEGAAQRREGSSPGTGAPAENVALESFTLDMTAEAREGRYSPAVGRDQERLEALKILSRKEKNNVLLLGEAGVGKTKIVEDLALRMVAGELDDLIGEKRIIEVNVAGMMSGTQYRGAFEEKFLALIRDLESVGDTILFIDEIHMIVGAGASGNDSIDMANMLKPAMARGKLLLIGATTFDEYEKSISKDPAMDRRFQTVQVDSLSPEATRQVLEQLAPSLERHHGIGVEATALDDAIALSERYMPNRQLPDKAIDVLDQAFARYRLRLVQTRDDPGASSDSMLRQPDGKVTSHDIRQVVSEMTSIPVNELTQKDRVELNQLQHRLREQIIGQDEAVSVVVSAIKRAQTGLADPDRPSAVFLFVGPTGTGKTELAKELAKALFKDKKRLITFDMSEFVEAHSVARLIGAPPGYVGSDEEGLLTKAIRKAPFSILLFDEIEKAHPQVFDIFLPLLDEGRVTDSKGRTVNCRNCIIIFTSNIAADFLNRTSEPFDQDAIYEALKRHFRPEFINRIDEVVPFYPLRPEDATIILRYLVNGVRFRLKSKGIGIRTYPEVYARLIEEGFNPALGARELKRAVERRIVNPVSEMIVEGRFAPGDMVDIEVKGTEYTYTKGKPHAEKAPAP